MKLTLTGSSTKFIEDMKPTLIALFSYYNSITNLMIELSLIFGEKKIEILLTCAVQLLTVRFG
jgi:hypothetical protein